MTPCNDSHENNSSEPSGKTLRHAFGKKTKDIYLVPEDNKLSELFFNLIDIGFEPRIRFQALVLYQNKNKV